MNDLQVVQQVEEELTPPRKRQPIALLEQQHSTQFWQNLKARDALSLLLPLGAFLLWLFSLHMVHAREMNDLGLVSVMSPLTIIALGIMTVSFCLTLQNKHLQKPLLLLHIALLIFMLYGITALVEDAPRFSTVYKHIGYTEYIMRTGSVNPGLDTYFSWPTFFILSAFFTKVAGFHDAISFVAWVPVFFNILYFGPLYLILQSLTSNQRVVWLGSWLFFLTNWIGQDYYSPQGINIFLYLTIIAMLLKWFKVLPKEQPVPQAQSDQKANLWRKVWGSIYRWFVVSDTLITSSNVWQKAGLLLILFGVFAFDISSHPLTPFFVLVSVTLLVFFKRIRPFWLPLPMWILTVCWILTMGRPFLEGHSSMVIGSFGLLGSAIASNVTDHVTGSPQHTLITELCLVMTALVWGLACLGGLRRLLQGYRDLTTILLAIAPFPLLVAQDYGGEMLLRIYLVSLPFMAFFVATLFYEPEFHLPRSWIKRGLTLLTMAVLTFFPLMIVVMTGLFYKRKPASRATRTTIGMVTLTLVLLALFLFARYGDERNDYVSTAELNAIEYLYRIAPHHSILMRSWEGGPWQFQDYENYDYYSLDDDALTSDIETNDYRDLIHYVRQAHAPRAYIVFMRTSQAAFASTSGLPPDRLTLFEHELLASGACKIIFENKDAQILLFV